MRKLFSFPLLLLAFPLAEPGGPRPKAGAEADAFRVEWRFKAAMPGRLYAHAAARIGDRIHVVGGRGERSEFTGYHYVYDISDDAWEIKAPMPSGSSNLAAAAWGGKLYVFGGNEQPEKTLAYDPLTDAWNPLAAVPTPRQHVNYSAVEATGKIHLIGGVRKIKDTGQRLFSVSDQHEIFDPIGNAWSAGTPLPAARQMPAIAFAGGKIYAMGGSDDRWIYNGRVEVLDLERQKWEKAAELPEACYPAGVAVVRNKIFVISGLREGHDLSRLYVYDPESDTWTFLSEIPVRVRQAQMVSHGNRLYIIGGATNEVTHSSCLEGEIIESK